MTRSGARPAFRRGDQGPAVAEIRAKLAVVGLLEPPTGAAQHDAVFDAACEQAVRAFQQQRGATSDGVVGAATYRMLDEARWRLGDRILVHTVGHLMAGDDVAALQHRLLDMGFDCGRVDGLLGRRTEAAIREFQRNVGLAVDGTAGPQTFAALARLSRTVVGGRPQALREAEVIHRSGPTLTGKIVVVDPGHGGTDRGVSANGLEEAALVEDVASRVERRLVAAGVQAFLTRGRDGMPSEDERAEFANVTDADLVISLHCDAHTGPIASGVATYFYGNDRYGHGSAVGETFAGLVHRELLARTDLLDCRVHGRTWDLLRRTRMPAVRIELGYLTNLGDAARLADPEVRDTVAEAVVVAVARLYLPADDGPPTGVIRLGELLAR